MNDNSGSNQSESKSARAPKAAAREANFEKGAALLAAFKRPGRVNDSNSTYLQLRVPESRRAVWYFRFQGLNGKREEGTLPGQAVFENGDGVTTIDYQQAKDIVKQKVRNARTPESKKHEEDNRARFRTLKDGFEYYLENRRKKGNRPLEDSTKNDYRKVFRIYLESRILDSKKFSKPPSEWDLHKTEVMQWIELLQAISKKSLSKANNCQAIISGIYGMGVALKVLESNPMTNTRYLNVLEKPPKRTRHVDSVDFPKFFASVESKLKRQNSKDPILVAIMTGTRLSACLGMRWDQLDFDNGLYYVLSGQEGWKGFSGVLPLSDFVLDLLKQRKSRAKRKSEYVFPSHHGDKAHRSSMGGALESVSSEFPKKVTAQDLRRTFATVVSLCFDDNMRKVGALLCHKWAVSKEGMTITRDDITRRYVQNTLRPLRETANTAANFILELAGKRPLSERTVGILKENDPHHLRLLELTEENEEAELERLASNAVEA